MKSRRTDCHDSGQISFTAWRQHSKPPPESAVEPCERAEITRAYQERLRHQTLSAGCVVDPARAKPFYGCLKFSIEVHRRRYPRSTEVDKGGCVQGAALVPARRAPFAAESSRKTSKNDVSTQHSHAGRNHLNGTPLSRSKRSSVDSQMRSARLPVGSPPPWTRVGAPSIMRLPKCLPFFLFLESIALIQKFKRAHHEGREVKPH